MRVVGRGQNAPGGMNPSLSDNHGAVVQRAVLEEDALDQPHVDPGIDRVSGRGVGSQVALPLDTDQGAGIGRGHIPTGFGDLFGPLEVAPDAGRPEDAPHEAVLGFGIAAPEQQEISPDLLLKDDDQGEYADADHLPHNGAEEGHVQGFDDDPKEVNDEDSGKDGHHGGAADHAVDLIEKHGDDQHVDDVENGDTDKIHRFSPPGVNRPELCR